jgi:hypothetical protein
MRDFELIILFIYIEEIVFIPLENMNISYDIIEGKEVYCNLNKENSNLIQ